MKNSLNAIVYERNTKLYELIENCVKSNLNLTTNFMKKKKKKIKLSTLKYSFSQIIKIFMTLVENVRIKKIILKQVI